MACGASFLLKAVNYKALRLSVAVGLSVEIWKIME